MTTSGRWIVIVLLLALSVLPALPALAQLPGDSMANARALERLSRYDGINAPWVRALFYQNTLEGEPVLCVALGIQRGPGQTLPGSLSFQRRSDEGDEIAKERLKFKFSRKAEQEHEGLMMWTSCLPAEDADAIPEDTMEITVRRMGESTETFVTDLPPAGATWGLDIWRQSGGELTTTDYREGG